MATLRYGCLVGRPWCPLARGGSFVAPFAFPAPPMCPDREEAMSLLPLVLLASMAFARDSDATEQEAASPAPSEWVAPSVDKAIQTGAKANKDAALIIGNQSYQDLPDAPYARNDSAAVYEHLRYTRGLGSYRLRTLNDATVADMEKGVRRVRGRVQRNGTLWIYFSGHLATTPDGRRVLLGSEQAGEEGLLAQQGYPLDDLVAYLAKGRQRQAIVVLDGSFGRQGRDGSYLVIGRDELQVAPFAGVDNTNVTVWVATTGDQVAGIYDPVRHGLFTWTMLGALRGWADGAQGDLPDGMVTLGEAQTYVSDVMRHMGRYQVPTLDDRQEIQDWVLGEFDGMEMGPSPQLLDEFAHRERADLLARTLLEADERASMDWMRVQSMIERNDPEAKQALLDYVRDWERPLLSIDWVQYVPYVREAQRQHDHWDEHMAALEADRAAREEASRAQAAAAAAAAAARAQQPDTGDPGPDTRSDPQDTGPGPDDTGHAVVEAPVDDSCSDLFKLQDQALAGTLRDGQIGCLETRIVEDKLMTDKEKVSRVLLVDAEAKKDLVRWEALMKRHLSDIDQSDPDLCFKYTIYLSKKGMENAEEVIIWGSRALERKDNWSGRLYEKKVFALHQLRAEAGMHLWQQAEQHYLEERSMQAEDSSNQARGRAKEFARAWLDYARASDQDTDIALKLCLSAAGAMEFCEEE